VQQAHRLGVAGHRIVATTSAPGRRQDLDAHPVRQVPSAVVIAAILSSISWFIRTSPYRRSLRQVKSAMDLAGVTKVSPEATYPHVSRPDSTKFRHSLANR
jgi:hypothetical protein